MTGKIVRKVERPPDETVEAFHSFTAAGIHEAMDKSGALGPEIARRSGTGVMCGPATTTKLPTGDNMMIHVGANVAAPGDVLVIEAKTTRAATWGELATRNAMRKGLEGVVSGGNTRDTSAIDDLEFPVFSRAVSHIGAVKETAGSVNVPVSVGGVVVNPGDIVVGDGDGVTVVPRECAEEIKDRSVEHMKKENEIRERIDDGEALFDIGGFAEMLSEHDIDDVESA